MQTAIMNFPARRKKAKNRKIINSLYFETVWIWRKGIEGKGYLNMGKDCNEEHGEDDEGRSARGSHFGV